MISVLAHVRKILRGLFVIIIIEILIIEYAQVSDPMVCLLCHIVGYDAWMCRGRQSSSG